MSIHRMREVSPARLIPTHFGPVSDPLAHLDQLETQIARFVEIAEGSRAAGEDQPALTARLHAEMAAQVAGAGPDLLERYEWATPSYMAAMGLDRYLSKRDVRNTPTNG